MRTPLASVPYLFLAAAVICGYLWHLGDIAALPENHAQAQGVAQIGGPFSLIDQNGQRRTDADFRGRYMLVFFGFTNCPDVCPTALAMFAEALKKLGPKADRIVPIFVSIDPEHDTPAVLKSYLASFGPRFVGLTGTSEDVAKAAKAYRVYYQKIPLEGGGYTMNHSSVIYLMGRDGKFLTHYGLEQGPDGLEEALARRL